LQGGSFPEKRATIVGVGQRLGQHFLFDNSILERIARAACGEHATDAISTVIEIGPGPGGLTAQLLPLCDKLVAVELDPALAEALRTRYASEPKFELIESDVLQADLSRWGPAVVVGNIPYYITSPIVDRALSLGPLLQRAVFLVQKEVADRLAAPPGSRDYGYLSVSTQARCTAKVLFSVKRGSFRPPPKVESAVILLEPLAEPVCDDLDGFLRFASICFRQKRKTLRNNLADLFEKAKIDALPEASSRAEQIPVSELARIFNILKV
jgi:16S rRNA (adenine1518-N6/adenine1519-N6)-dimethyltransferase